MQVWCRQIVRVGVESITQNISFRKAHRLFETRGRWTPPAPDPYGQSWVKKTHEFWAQVGKRKTLETILAGIEESGLFHLGALAGEEEER